MCLRGSWLTKIEDKFILTLARIDDKHPMKTERTVEAFEVKISVGVTGRGNESNQQVLEKIGTLLALHGTLSRSTPMVTQRKLIKAVKAVGEIGHEREVVLVLREIWPKLCCVL